MTFLLAFAAELFLTFDPESNPCVLALHCQMSYFSTHVKCSLLLLPQALAPFPLCIKKSAYKYVTQVWKNMHVSGMCKCPENALRLESNLLDHIRCGSQCDWIAVTTSRVSASASQTLRLWGLVAAQMQSKRCKRGRSKQDEDQKLLSR